MDTHVLLLVVLASAASSVQAFVSVFVYVYVLLILVHVLLSWIPIGATGALDPVRRFLHEVCEPYLSLFRRIIPTIGPLDISPIAAILALTIGERLLNGVIGRVL